MSKLRKLQIIQNNKQTLSRLADRMKIWANFPRRMFAGSAMRSFDRIQLGSGGQPIPGWANIDLVGKKNIIWDLRRPLPIPEGSLRYVFSEHFIEHVTREDGLRILTSCREMLSPEGVLRISTPNLRRTTEDYLNGTIPTVFGGWLPQTPCRMLNDAMRLWGHTFVYDETEMRLILKEAGFKRIVAVRSGESDEAELRNLETRPYYDDLIFEARR